MRFLIPGYRSSSSEKWTLGVLLVIFFYVVLYAVLPDGTGGIIRCPWHEFLGLDCPGCGITRAGIQLLRLHPLAALRLNPLIVFVLPYAAYRMLSIVVGMLTGRVLADGLPLWFVNAYQWLFVAGVILLGGWRFALWAIGL